MRRILALPAISLIALIAACGDDTTGTGGEGGSGGARPTTSTATSTKSSSSSSGMTTTSSSTTTNTTTTTTTNTTGMGGEGGEGGQGGQGGGPPGGEVNCADTLDDDSDGDIDCADADCAASAACGNLVVNELDYDMSGADDFEFVEVFNAGAGPVSLDGVSVEIINGVSGTVSDSVPLTGMLPAGGYLVVADAGVVVDPQATVVLLPDNVENGPTDAVAIYDANSNVVVDAISYEGAVSAVDINGTDFDLGMLEGGSPTVTDNGSVATFSLVRLPNGTDTNVADADWKGTTALTPGASNVGVENCANLVDDDGDGDNNCEDTDCSMQSCGPLGVVCIGNVCECPGGQTETTCNDGNDNDCDGSSDCADSDCTGSPSCSEICNDMMDNNGNGLVDCMDMLCDGQSCGPNGLTCAAMICVCPGGGSPETACGDTSDNDCDGLVDCADSDCAAACAPPALYFSEYVEGSSNNKAVEIHNPSNTPFDLAAASCSVRIYANGAAMPGTTVALSGTIAAGDVHVVCNNMGSAMLTPLCDQLAGGMMMGNINHNGNDALELVCNGTTLDVIGQIGFDPGAEWGTGLTSTADNTLRRSCTLFPDTNGADAFDPAVEWTGFAQDTFAGLGVRSCPGTP